MSWDGSEGRCLKGQATTHVKASGARLYRRQAICTKECDIQLHLLIHGVNIIHHNSDFVSQDTSFRHLPVGFCDRASGRSPNGSVAGYRHHIDIHSLIVKWAIDSEIHIKRYQFIIYFNSCFPNSFQYFQLSLFRDPFTEPVTAVARTWSLATSQTPLNVFPAHPDRWARSPPARGTRFWPGTLTTCISRRPLDAIIIIASDRNGHGHEHCRRVCRGSRRHPAAAAVGPAPGLADGRSGPRPRAIDVVVAAPAPALALR